MSELFEILKSYTKNYAEILVQERQLENELAVNHSEQMRLQKEKTELEQKLQKAVQEKI
jgi:hypothetical protein